MVRCGWGCRMGVPATFERPAGDRGASHLALGATFLSRVIVRFTAGLPRDRGRNRGDDLTIRVSNDGTATSLHPAGLGC
jgi:hypothetical protein